MDTLSLTKGGKNIQRRKDNLFNKWCWENRSTTCKRMKLEHFLTPYTKINSKWMYKTLRGEHRQNTLQHKPQQDPYDPPPRVMEIKAKINKWDLIKLKSLCITKETISKVKRRPSEWEKIIANEATDKELISKIYK